MQISVIDTGSIIEIRRLIPRTVRPQVLKELDRRVLNGALVFPPEVVTELRRVTDEIRQRGQPDDPCAWATRNERIAARHGHLYDGAKAVLSRVKNLIDPQRVALSGIDDADPYVIALGMQLKSEGHEIVIITEDFHSKPKKTALADAAGVFRVPCVRFRTFLIDEEIWDGQ